MSDTELAELEKQVAELATQEATAKVERRKEELRLKLKFSKELGPQGSAFDIIRTPDGPIVIALGDSLFYRKLAALKRDEKTDTFNDADLHAIIAPNVKHPDAATFAQLADKRGGLRAACLFAFKALHEAQEEERQGK